MAMAAVRTGGRAGFLAHLLLFALLCAGRRVQAAPAAPTDVFVSPYAALTDAQPQDFQRWSNASTWPSGAVPGVGSAVGADALVPPGVAILLDVPAVQLGRLQIKGLLQVLDHPSLPSIYVKANSILVEGQLSAGTPARQFSQKLTFELTPNPNNRAPLLFTSFAPAEPLYPRNLGHKAFAVVGGQLHLHGLPGGSNTPTWCQLNRTALPNDTTIFVTANVAGSWPVGSRIVVTSTDYDRNQAEEFTITAVNSTSSGAILSLDQPLRFMHWGQLDGLSDGFGGFVDERAEVALLSRNIVVTGTDEAAPYDLEGGHFIIYMTNRPQFIEGVQFWKMGQQGNLGRYSLHFHAVGCVPETVCHKNTILESKQRCIVVHASHNITVSNNVAYKTQGHCFMLEEGSEVNNTFIENIGIVTNAVTKRIPSSANPTTSDETDNEPSTFWIVNSSNDFIRNRATGSEHSGFWIELRARVRGMSLNIPGVNTTVPFHTRWGEHSGNVAHSNKAFGLRTYPHGSRPRNADGSVATGIISGLIVYKNSWSGVFSHNTDQLVIDSATFADNTWGIMLNQDESTILQNSRLVGLTNNFGNPSQCFRTDIWTNCKPIVGCTMPVASTRLARSVGNAVRTASTFGVLIDQGNRSDSGARPVQIVSTSFANYTPTCNNAAAIAMVGLGDLWNPSQSIQKLKFAPNTNRIFSAPRFAMYNPWNDIQDGGEQSQFYTLWDTDGSIIGAPGYVVTNNTKILPPNRRNCTYNAKWNAYGCIGTCYRTIQISYLEPGFEAGWAAANNTPGDFSSIVVTRSSDRQSLSLFGNLNQFFVYAQVDTSQRFFHMTLLAGQTYSITFVPGRNQTGFSPSSLTVRYKDGGGCGQGLTLRFPPAAGVPWTLADSDTVFLKQCPDSGVSPPASTSTTYGPLCLGQAAPWLEVAMAPSAGDLALLPAPSSLCPTPPAACAVLWSGSGYGGGPSGWLYDDSGLDSGAALLRAPLLLGDASASQWQTGAAPLGYTSWGSDYIVTTVQRPSASRVAYYYRRSFGIKSSKCYTALRIDVIVQDGIVLYLNGQELPGGRSNMPAGPITNSTLATVFTPAFTWQTFTFPLPGPGNLYNLVEGTNSISVQQHVNVTWAYQLAMDMRVSAIRRSSCSGALISPEVCDGLDNNFNGKVDEGLNGRPLTRPCSTPCGNGTATCVGGQFVCSMRMPTAERCNLIDDNCDGLVDNGAAQLDCPAEQACYAGRCLPVQNATASTQVWPRNASNWAYNDSGNDLNAIDPTWRMGTSAKQWSVGQAPLGFNYYVPAWDWAKTTINNFGAGGKSATAYFLKSFNLTQTELNDTYSLDFSIRRVDGAVVYLNGVELERQNLPWGPLAHTTTAAIPTQDAASSPGSDCCNLQWTYNRCTACFRNTSSPLKAGVNWIAAEVHLAWIYEKQAAFDMDLFRMVKQPCAAGECVRQTTQPLLVANSIWQYSDATLPLPAANWMMPSFNASSWPTGMAPLGVGPQWLIRKYLNRGQNTSDPQRTLYFRKTLDVPDARCYFSLAGRLLANDGAVLYINGVEAFRMSMSDPITADTFAWFGGDWSYRAVPLTGGWLKPGANVVAVELHRAQSSIANAFFDFQMTGSREALTCLPAPL